MTPAISADPVDPLDIEAEEEDVAVRDDVLLPFGPRDAFFAGTLPAAIGDELGIGDRLGADEALLEIRVNHAGRNRRRVPAMDGPCTDFLLAGREIGLEAEEVIPGADEPIETCRLDA